MGGTKRNTDMSVTEDTVKHVKAPSPVATATEAEEKKGSDKKKVAKKAVVARQRSGKYKAVRSKLDKTKQYSAKEAVELVKKFSYSSFTGSVDADLVLREAGERINIKFPHSTGKSITAVVFNDDVLKDIEAGNINFDILLAAPADMKKLTKFARILGPKGLMPNPKNGTLTAKPELKKKELEGGKITIKTEKKAPLMHVKIGKTDMETKALVANINALTKALKDKLVKLSISATMSPGVKIAVEE
jgi:large subunit ribosomal protein L1